LVLEEFYGEDFMDISDEDVADFAKENDFMRAQHILMKFLTVEEGYTQQEIDDNKLILRTQIDDLLILITEHKDDDNFLDFFSEMVKEHSQDPGSLTSPDGYLFQPHVMVPPFSEACAALLPGQFSGVVETSYGYHIILRLPIVDFDAYPSGEYYTLRQLALPYNFEKRMQEWRDSMTIEFTPEYDSLVLSDIFVWCDCDD